MKGESMIDRKRKQQADRERRALIKAGKWDFPDGGSAERARAGLPLDNNPARQRAAIPTQKTAEARKTYSFPRASLISPTFSAPPSAPISPPSSSRALAVIPTTAPPAPTMRAGRLVKRPPIIGHPEIGEWRDPNTREITQWQLEAMAQNWRMMREENDALRQRSEAAGRAVEAAREAQAEQAESIKNAIGFVAALFGLPCSKLIT